MTALSAQSAGSLSGLIFEAMNTKNMALLEPYLAEDVMFDFPGTDRVVGKKRVLIFLKALLRKFPDIYFQLQDVIAGHDKACIVWTNSARLQTSQPYLNSGVTLVHCDMGRITFISDYFKDTSFVGAAGTGSV
jgi:ketosteroid isomerase-like protein